MMNKPILITGVAGSGKSAVSDKLRTIGYKAFDIENIDGLFTMINKTTGQPFADYDNDDFDKVKQGEWICDLEKLKKIIQQNSDDLVFYCGTASNLDELMPLFDKTFLLQIDHQTTRHRLTDRTSNDFGRTAEVQDWILEWKDWWEEQMIAKGAIVIDASRPLVQVVRDIVKKTGGKA